jgi:hypothetical protein
LSSKWGARKRCYSGIGEERTYEPKLNSLYVLSQTWNSCLEINYLESQSNWLKMFESRCNSSATYNLLDVKDRAC